MELYHEDRKVLIIGLQTSVIIHLLIYILLKLLPGIELQPNTYQQPVEIKIEEAKRYQQQKVEIKKSDMVQKQTIPAERVKESLTPEKTQQTFKRQEEHTSQKTEKVDENDKTSQIPTGEPLSKFDRNVEGDAISRMVVYRPPPIKLETDIPQPSVKVKIFISPSGDVTKVQLLTLTSDPYLNREIVSYMLKWKFNRIEENIIQYAVLTIYFSR